jgi:hypothetical protein
MQRFHLHFILPASYHSKLTKSYAASDKPQETNEIHTSISCNRPMCRGSTTAKAPTAQISKFNDRRAMLPKHHLQITKRQLTPHNGECHDASDPVLLSVMGALFSNRHVGAKRSQTWGPAVVPTLEGLAPGPQQGTRRHEALHLHSALGYERCC